MYNKRDTRHAVSLMLIVAVLILSGCQSNPSVLDENFGSSVRNMIAVQTAQPREGTPSMDGRKGEAVLGAYRADVAKPKQVDRDIINIKLGK